MQPKKNAFGRSLSQPLISIPIREGNNIENQKNNSEEMEILKIIDSALNVETAKKNFSKNNFYTRDDLLLKTKENSVMNFLTSLQNKNISQLKDSFISKINENTKGSPNKNIRLQKHRKRQHAQIRFNYRTK